MDGFLSSLLASAVVIVTGASSGIGRSTAIGVARCGARVCLVARRERLLEEVGDEIARAGGRAMVVRADLRRDEDLTALVERLGSEGVDADILIHCAGVNPIGAIAEAPVLDLDAAYEVNVRAPWRLTQLLLPSLRARRGQIVFVNSSAGVSTRAGVAAYAASKHALRAVADTLRHEVNADGVRIVSVYPGRTATPLQAELHALEGKTYRPEALLQPDDVASVIVQALLMNRTAEITDIHVRPLQKA